VIIIAEEKNKKRLILLFKAVFLIILIFYSYKSYPQVKRTGIPGIKNYPRSVYSAGTQNWGITQDERGFIYFANNDGVLRFDGISWELFRISSASAVRSVHVSSENQIYVGTYNDFGLLKPDSQGRLVFESLRHLLPADTIHFGDIWRIHESDNLIIFQSFHQLFLYDGRELEVKNPQGRFFLSFHVHNDLYVQEPDAGIFKYASGQLEKTEWSDELEDMEVLAMVEINDSQILVGTGSDGVFRLSNGYLEKWDTPANRLIEEYKLYSAIRISEEFIAFGTILNGIVISDSFGNVVQHINMSKGLQNNTILSMFADRNNNLWLGLDNGIDHVEINSPLTFLSGKDGPGAGYSAIVYDEGLYLGTNQGLFYMPFDQFEDGTGDFELVENTTGQVWALEQHDGQLLCSHHLGAFIIEKNRAVKISNDNGYWGFKPLRQNGKYLLGGTYNGLVLLEKGNNGWEYSRRLHGFSESSRFLLQDRYGDIWISHGARGIFRLKLNEELDSVNDYRLYNSAHGLPASEQNIIFHYRDQEYVSTVDGIYKYNAERDSFVKAKELNEMFSFNGRMKTLKSDSAGNFWFITENESGVLRLNEDMTYTKITSPFEALRNRYINGFEFLYPFSDEHVFFAIENGFAHYSNKILKPYNRPFQAFVVKVELPYLDSSVVVINSSENLPEFAFKQNAFRFHYTAPFYESPEGLKFSYLLENHNKEWSEWSADPYKDFTNLPEGKYVFQVKAQNIYGTESLISSYPFRIKPPWYRSSLAYYMYLFMFTGLIMLTVKFVLYRMEREKYRVMEQHRADFILKEDKYRLQKLMTEKEIIRLRNERLQNEMMYRDKELANQTMSIIQKNKFLVSLKEELQGIQKSVSDDKVKRKLSGLNRNINKEIDNKQQNQIFETYFDGVHQEFFQALKEKYPDLSPREMRLCAYIKMNLSSKEIAALFNITDRGVEISRYRLRRKMDLPRDVNLSIFLSNI
jgi:ligand-binding sensor domain-containing protein/DNA-binding CsgD family transcriptional regulator